MNIETAPWVAQYTVTLFELSFYFEVGWFFMSFFWIANVWILNLRTFNIWICFIWTDLISVLGVLQLLGAVNFVVLILRDFHNDILKWRLMVKIWKIWRCIARGFLSRIQALSENIDSCIMDIEVTNRTLHKYRLTWSSKRKIIRTF